VKKQVVEGATVTSLSSSSACAPEGVKRQTSMSGHDTFVAVGSLCFLFASTMPSSKKQRGKQRKEAKLKKEGEQKKLTCLHGSTQDEALREEYRRGLKDFLDISVADRDDRDIALSLFKDAHQNLCAEQDFANFLLAYCVQSLYDGSEAQIVMCLHLHLFYVIIPESQGQYVGPGSKHCTDCLKYLRRVGSRRGLIRTVSRYAPCTCLDQLAAATKDMEKTEMCFACMNHIRTNEIKYCAGCKSISYCSAECQPKGWYVTGSLRDPAHCSL